MTVGEFKKIPWLKVDLNIINCYIQLTPKSISRILTGYNIYNDIDEGIERLMRKLMVSVKDKHLFWEFTIFGGKYYLDVVQSGIDFWNGDYDSFKIIEFNLNNQPPALYVIE